MKKTTTSARICGQHGEYTATTTITTYAAMPWDEPEPPLESTTGCPDCEKEQKEKRAEEWTKREAEWKEKRRREQLARNRELADIPLRFVSSSFDNYIAVSPEQKRALSTAQRFVDNHEAVFAAGSTLTFCGGPGTGKTHLACAIASRWLDVGYTVAYVQVAELIRAIRETWNTRSQTESSVSNRYRNTGLLILDEVGASFGGESERVQLFDLLDWRYRQLRPSLIVSNLNANGLQQALGPRTYDRLMQKGNTVVVFDWKSHRSQAASVSVSREELSEKVYRNHQTPPRDPYKLPTFIGLDPEGRPVYA